MPLTEALWPQFTMHIFEVQLLPPFGENSEITGSPTYTTAQPPGNPNLIYLFKQISDKMYHLTTIHAQQIDNKQTNRFIVKKNNEY